jgi:hypothetical protein
MQFLVNRTNLRGALKNPRSEIMESIDLVTQQEIFGGNATACGIGIGIVATLALSGPAGWAILGAAGEAGGVALAAACAA